MNIEKNYVVEKLPRHPEHFSKSEVGKTLIVAGSHKMVGAAIFSTGGAMRAGAGMVYLCTQKEARPTIQTWFPEVVCTNYEDAQYFLDRYDAMSIGPGMGTEEKTLEMLGWFVENFTKPMVIDADGLNTIAANEELQKKVKERAAKGYITVMTPHFNEAKRLMGIKPEEASVKTAARFGHDVYRRSLAKQLYEKYNAIIVVKGAGTIVYGGGDYFVNTTGNVGMATAGSGDVLTGIITSFLAQGIEPFDAALCGVYVHGFAGDKASEELGPQGVLARDIVDHIPYAMKALR